MKIIIFGIGEIYKQYKDMISKEDKIIAFIDNNKRIQKKKINGVKVYSPEQIKKMLYDKIVIMSNYSLEMKSQLLQLGCEEDKILHYLDYIGQSKLHKLEICFSRKRKYSKNTCLIVSNTLDYTGGPITAIYMALELQSRGYDITIAAPNGNECFIKELIQKGIIVCIYHNLQFAKLDELFWIERYQTIIVNTYPMVLCALEIAKKRKVIIWLHESNNIYIDMEFWKNKIKKDILNPNINLYAVSNVAKKNFINNVVRCKIGIMPYGIPDIMVNFMKIHKKLTFAVIGTIHPIKQQLLYIEAIKQLDISEQMNNRFLIIGNKSEDSEYVHNVKCASEVIPNIRLIGGFARNEMEKIYKYIDVIVVSSKQETMSLVATEAMMYGKVCILCDAAGMAEFVVHKKNGLLYETNNINSLKEQIRFCIKNKNYLTIIGKNARDTYNKNFTMSKFGERLEKILHV